MKLDATAFRYLSKDEFRVLTACEMAMKNHEIAADSLIASIAGLSRGIVFKILQTLLRHKLVAHERKMYDGFRLTYHGYDFLALRALVARGTIRAVGRRLGVGKESDVHYAEGPNGEVLAIKLHRLGRVSFRSIKTNRDYLQHRTHASWMYMARLAAAKEFAYMKALKDEGFPVPVPHDQNRHCVVMSLVHAEPLYHFRYQSIDRPQVLLERLMRLLVRLARAGIIHGDFNEYNLMVSPELKVTLIDFPQVVSFTHVNAREYFDRDVGCVIEFFKKKMHYEVTSWPTYDEVLAETQAESCGEKISSALASVVVEGMGDEDNEMLVRAHECPRREPGEETTEAEEEGESEEDDDEDDDEDEEDAGNAAVAGNSFEGLVPEEGREALGLPADDDLATAEAAEKEEAATGEAKVLAASSAKDPADEASSDAEEDDEGESSEEEAAPGQVEVKPGGKKTRKRQSAKDARAKLHKERKAKPAKPNNAKNKDMRKAREEIKEMR